MTVKNLGYIKFKFLLILLTLLLTVTLLYVCLFNGCKYNREIQADSMHLSINYLDQKGVLYIKLKNCTANEIPIHVDPNTYSGSIYLVHSDSTVTRCFTRLYRSQMLTSLVGGELLYLSVEKEKCWEIAINDLVDINGNTVKVESKDLHSIFCSYDGNPDEGNHNTIDSFVTFYTEK